MSENQLINQCDKTLEDLVPSNNRYIFIVGAGISIDPPSSLLPAPQFVRHLLKLCAPEEEIENLLSLETLRYEIIVEILQRYIDYNLEFLDYFELGNQPNLIHLFLAHAIANGHSVYTTNFDYLIEHALMKILPNKKKSDIIPVITKNDYLQYPNSNKAYSDGKYPVYKLHGAKRNIITNIKTTDSLITTISAFGKGDTLLSLDPYKKKSLSEISKNQTLIILGYSGSDDFDIAPVLRTLFDIKTLIWIDHLQEDSTEIYEFDPKKAFIIPKGLSRVEKLLAEISSNTEAEVILVKAHTRKFIESKLWQLILSDVKLSEEMISELSKEPKMPSFEKWIAEKFANVSPLIKWKCAADIYAELGFKGDFLRCAETGLKEAENAKSVRMIPEFLNLLGVYHFNQVDNDKALPFFERALKMNTETGRTMLQATQLNNIGLISLRKKEFNEAMNLFEKAFDIAKKRGDYRGMSSRLNNMGLTFLEQKEYEKALEKLQEALKYDKKTGNLSGRVIRLKNIGEVYKAKEKYPEALENYRNAYSIVQKLSDRIGMGRILIEIGKTYSYLNDFGKAITNLQKAIKFLKEAGDKINLLEAEEALIETKKNLR